MEIIFNAMLDVYLSNSNLDARTRVRLLENEMYLDSAQSLEYGLADAIIE